MCWRSEEEIISNSVTSLNGNIVPETKLRLVSLKFNWGRQKRCIIEFSLSFAHSPHSETIVNHFCMLILLLVFPWCREQLFQAHFPLNVSSTRIGLPIDVSPHVNWLNRNYTPTLTNTNIHNNFPCRLYEITNKFIIHLKLHNNHKIIITGCTG